MRKLVIRMLSTILLCSVLTTGCTNGMNEATAETRTIYDDYRDGHFGKYSFHEMLVNIPDGWSVDEYSDDNAIYCRPDYGLFNIYYCEPDIDITDLDSEEHPIISKGLSEARTIEYVNSTWSVRDYKARSTDTEMEGFWAETIFNEHKYLIFVCSNSKVDRNADLQEIMDSIYFEQDRSMYNDGDFDINGEYSLATIREINSGVHNEKIVAVDAVLGKYGSYRTQDTENMLAVMKGETSEVISSRTIRFDAWFSDGGGYVCNEDWIIHESDYTEQFIKQFDDIDDGDVVRLYFYVKYNSVETLKWAELLEKSTLEEKMIDYPVIIETEPIETQETQGTTEYIDKDRVVYITESGSKYHTATCRWVSDSCIEISYETAISRGYTPCGTCNPSS